jgi:patatin-like phospholipase/acyl hydrolase
MLVCFVSMPNHEGSFRVTQKIALRATTAAPTFFKPLLSFDELYVDGGIVASNPTAVAVHEARTIFPNVSVMAYLLCILQRWNHINTSLSRFLWS